MNTCDPNEIKHFQSLSNTWWDEGGPFRLLHAMTPLRMAFLTERIKRSFLRRGGNKPIAQAQQGQRSDLSQRTGGSEEGKLPLKGMRILDVGCGGGLLCEPLSRLGADVIGIDPVEKNVRTAMEHAKAGGLSITYHPYAIEAIPVDFPKVDVIVASEILEHVENPEAFLRACASHIKPGGGIFLSTLNRTLKSYLLGIVAAEHILQWAPRGTHSWEKFVSPDMLSQTLQDLGFSYQELQGVCLSPLTQRWRFSPSLSINYFMWGERRGDTIEAS